MKLIIPAVWALSSVSALCVLAEPPTTQPAPSLSAKPQSEATTIEPTSTLLLLPFQELAGAQYPWVGRALQQDLLADLSHTTRAKVVAPSGAMPAGDAAAALQSARQAGAAFVVYGQYQTINGQMRITGQLLNVSNESTAGSMSATGPVNNLFPLEDTVASQVLRTLPPTLLSVTLPPAEPGSPSQPSPPSAASGVSPAEAAAGPRYYSYTYPDYSSVGYSGYPYYSYGYGSPWYWYSYPYYGGDLFFYGGWDYYHHHFGDHGHWHGGDHHDFGGRGYGSPGFSHDGYGAGHGGYSGGGHGGGFSGGHGGGFSGGHGGGGGHR